MYQSSLACALLMVYDMLCLTEWATVLFVIQLSLGESIWSPRWYDYSMSVAPEGREGVFTAMASAPLFLGKFVTGEALWDPTCHNWDAVVVMVNMTFIRSSTHGNRVIDDNAAQL